MSSGGRLTVNVSKVSYETIDGEVVIINFENGNYYSLVGTAAEIWSMLEGGASTGEIIDAVAGRYAGERNAMESALVRFVEELCHEDLLIRGNGSGPDTSTTSPRAIERDGGDARPAFEAPVLSKYSEVQDLLVLDPVHEVDESGLPDPKLGADD